jgi:hypothetical protein
MILETALILNYQTVRGVLYQDLGLLLTAFMAGLAVGAGVMDRRSRGSREGPGRGLGLALIGALAALCLLTAWLVETGAVTGLAVTGLLLAAAGFLVAAVFAYASLFRSPDQRRVISPLYASDLIGGSLGALTASLLLIPATGMAGTGLAAAVVAALTALLL